MAATEAYAYERCCSKQSARPLVCLKSRTLKPANAYTLSQAFLPGGGLCGYLCIGIAWARLGSANGAAIHRFQLRGPHARSHTLGLRHHEQHAATAALSEGWLRMSYAACVVCEARSCSPAQVAPAFRAPSAPESGRNAHRTSHTKSVLIFMQYQKHHMKVKQKAQNNRHIRSKRMQSGPIHSQ